MLALDLCLVMRMHIPQQTRDEPRVLSITLMLDHTWALRGWVEAAARGELPPCSNTLVHIDDHTDLMGMKSSLWRDSLDLGNVDDLIARYVCSPSDPLGIGSYIAPAAYHGLVSSMYWIYGQKRTAEADERNAQQISWLNRCDDVNMCRRMQRRIIPHADRLDYDFRGIVSFPGLLHGFCSDNIPWASLASPIRRSKPGGRILNIDVDVQDELADFESVVRPFIERIDLFHAVTIAASPQFGANLNHLEKILSVLKMLKEKGMFPGE